MKRWILLLPAVLFGCPQFAPDDVCGYPGFCDGSVADGGDGGKDGGVTCPSGKEPKDDPACVTDTLGIFVAPSPTGNDANAGTRAAPVATLKVALQKVASKSFIFVCEGNYTESVDIKQSASIFGGFKCTDWSYSATVLPKFTATKPDYVFYLDGANNSVIGDLELDAMDGAPGTGQSSVGMFVANSQNVKVERLNINAASGADGFAGTVTNFGFPDAGVLAGKDAIDLTNGGPANTQVCPKGDSSTGGKGGNSGFPGDPGQPLQDGGGGGGVLGPDCTNGTGKNGLSGQGGVAGVSITTLGILSAQGWTPQSGNAGTSGNVGQGGGGGAGITGAGGGGGCGGCGGADGSGGAGGGGSIALASVDSTVSVTASHLKAGVAGKGGSGAAGQSGQSSGGFGGTRSGGACNGGNGGAGGNGGGGSGGAGGVSIGVLSKGGSVTIDASTQGNITTGTPGAKGTGAAGNDGIPGVANASLAL